MSEQLTFDIPDLIPERIGRVPASALSYQSLWVRNRKRDLRDWLRALKAKRGCDRCGERHPSCLDFHHRDPSGKRFGIGKLITYSTDVYLAEIAKCDLLCANCHRKEHYLGD